MRTMEDAHLFKQDDCNATTRSLSDLRAQFREQSFDFAPLSICARRMSKDQLQRPLVPSFHDKWYHAPVLR